MKKYLLFILIPFLVSCAGIKFSPISHNKQIPNDLKNRTFWKETDIFKYNLEQLTGSIIYVSADGNSFMRGSRVIDISNPPSTKTIKNGLLYNSKINRDMNAGISILSFTADLKTNQMVDIKVTDILESFVDFENIPIERVKDVIKNEKLRNTKKYYIQGALLTSIVKEYGSEIDANAEGVLGGAYGANGKVYNEETTLVQDYKISLALIDLNKLDVLLAGAPLMENQEEKVAMLKSALAEEIIIDEIRGF